MRELIHFVHGNGFPSSCYRQLFKHLDATFDCTYIDRLGHSINYPVSENWHHLIDELIASVEEQSKSPVVGLGHSFGGVVSFMAAIRRPELFRRLILLDSPLFGFAKSTAVRLCKRLSLIEHITPARRTRKRRRAWQSKEEALTYLRSRVLFKYFSDACLEDFVDYGLMKTIQGYELRFDGEVEYQIFCTIPHMLHRYEGQCTVPVTLIYGDRSSVVGPGDRRYMKKKYGIHSVKTQGTHMFPMEYPKETARLVIDICGA